MNKSFRKYSAHLKRFFPLASRLPRPYYRKKPSHWLFLVTQRHLFRFVSRAANTAPKSKLGVASKLPFLFQKLSDGLHCESAAAVQKLTLVSETRSRRVKLANVARPGASAELFSASRCMLSSPLPFKPAYGCPVVGCSPQHLIQYLVYGSRIA